MEKIALILVLVVMACVTIFGLTAGETAVNRHYDTILEPAGAIDAVLTSRQTPPITPQVDRNNNIVAVLAVLIIATVASIGLAFLIFGERVLKQYRLLTKQNKPRPAVYAPQLPRYQQNDWSQVPNVPPNRQLPAPEDRRNEW